MAVLTPILVCVAVIGAFGLLLGHRARRSDDGPHVEGPSQWRTPWHSGPVATLGELPGDADEIAGDPDPQGSPDAELTRRVPLPPPDPPAG